MLLLNVHSPLFGFSLCTSPRMVETVTEEQRVRGGYLDRWLIRRVVTVTRPSRQIIHDRVNSRIYCHPVMAAEIQRAINV